MRNMILGCWMSDEDDDEVDMIRCVMAARGYVEEARYAIATKTAL